MTEGVKENKNLQITLTLSVTVVTVLDNHPKFDDSKKESSKKFPMSR